MNRGLKHLCVLFTCLSVVMFSSILVMADENEEDINLPVDVEQEVEIEESDEDEPLIIEENENSEEVEADEDISIGEDEIIEDQEELDEETSEEVTVPSVVTIEIDCKKSVIPGKDVVISPSYGRSVNTTGVYRKQLTGVDAATYDILKDRFTDVAYGRLSSTEFTISLDELGFDNVFTAEELGIDYIPEFY